MAHKTMIDGTVYEISGGQDMVDGTVYGVKDGRTLIGGTAYEIPFAKSKPLAEYAEGDVVYLAENGAETAFYVACHNYESGLNGSGRTLLVRKDCYNTRAWHSSNVNAYAASAIDSWLNGDYKALLATDIQSAVGTIKIKYIPGTTNVAVNTLERAVFLLSSIELGKAVYQDGSELPIAGSLQTAYLNGAAVAQWTRTPTDSMKNAYYISSAGSLVQATVSSNSIASRPAFTLPDTVQFDPGTNGFISV